MDDHTPRRFIRFTQADIKRAAKGMTEAGRPDFDIKIDPNGNMFIRAGSASSPSRGNSWDDIDDT